MLNLYIIFNYINNMHMDPKTYVLNPNFFFVQLNFLVLDGFLFFVFQNCQFKVVDFLEFT